MSCTHNPNEACLTPHEIHHSRFMGGIGLASILASFAYAPFCSHGPVLCPFRLITGLPCPGCGLTRSFCAISQGHLHDALRYHLLGVPLFVAVLIGSPLLLFQGFTGWRIRWLNQLIFSKRLAYAAAAILMSYHSLRLMQMLLAGSLWSQAHGTLVGLLLHR